MLIIDRYVLRQFVKTFVICYISLTGLFIMFHAFTNLEVFLRCAERAGGLLKLMFSFYGCQAVLFFDQTSAVLALVSAMFTLTWIQRHNELTALMAAGISRARVLRPIVVAAVAVSLAAAADRELLIPGLSRELSRSPQDLLGDAAHDLKPWFDDQTQICIRGKSAYLNEMRIERPNFWLPQELGGGELKAAKAYYKQPEGGRPAGYLFVGVTAPAGLTRQPSLKLKGWPVVLTPRDAPWLKPDQCFVVSSASFDQIINGQGIRQYYSTFHLMADLRNSSMDYGPDVRVMVHSRLLQPILDIVLLFLGMPLVISRENRNVFMAIGLCLVVVSCFMGVVMAFHALGGQSVIRPATAAWVPLMIFVPAAIRMAEGMWREAAGSRPLPRPPVRRGGFCRPRGFTIEIMPRRSAIPDYSQVSS